MVVLPAVLSPAMPRRMGRCAIIRTPPPARRQPASIPPRAGQAAHCDSANLTLLHSSMASRSSGQVTAASSKVLPEATASVATRLARAPARLPLGMPVRAAAKEPKGVVPVNRVQVGDVQHVDAAGRHRPDALQSGEVLFEVTGLAPALPECGALRSKSTMPRVSSRGPSSFPTTVPVCR